MPFASEEALVTVLVPNRNGFLQVGSLTSYLKWKPSNVIRFANGSEPEP